MNFISMPFPPRAKKSAPLVQEGRQRLAETSNIIHQHRFSLASQVRKFDARWASLFNLAPVLGKLTKGRQMPKEFHDNTQVLFEDVQVALENAHSRKLAKIPEESIIPGPPPPVSIPIPTEQSDKPSIIVRVRSKLKRKKAVKHKGSRKGLARFNPFRSKPRPTPAATIEPPTLRTKTSRRTVRSGGGSSRSSRRRNKGHRRSKTHTSPPPPSPPPVIPTEFKPYLPPPPNFSPLKMDMSSIGHYSPTIAKPLLRQPPPWPGVGIVNPSTTPSSPQPYYLSVHDEKKKKPRREKREKKKSRERLREVPEESREPRKHRRSRSREDTRKEKERERSSSHRRDRSKERDHRRDEGRSDWHNHHDRTRGYESDSTTRRHDYDDRYHDSHRSHHRKHHHRSSDDRYHTSRYYGKRRDHESLRSHWDDDYYPSSRRDRHYSEPSKPKSSSHHHQAQPTTHSNHHTRTHSRSHSHSNHHHYQSPYDPNATAMYIDGGLHTAAAPRAVEQSRFKENFSAILSTAG